MTDKDNGEGQDDEKSVDARPTKEFFISMLVRDIDLIPAMIDLVDNSVDGARRLHPDGDYKKCSIRLSTQNDRFEITDNCGGIPFDVARHYAFRFGRPEDFAPTAHSLGQFGVGMKRALFKLGKKFKVHSTHQQSREFTLEVDVDDWKKQPEPWSFEIKEVKNAIAHEVGGTSISVYVLNDGVSQAFKLPTFVGDLRLALGRAHQDALSKGLALSVDGVALAAKPLSFKSSKTLVPMYTRKTLKESGGVVEIRIYSGISESNPSEAGWYVFCNGRLLLGPDQTNVTGWGDDEADGIPQYHNQYARYRGFVFIDASNSALLPWNTTKTGVDADAPLYRGVRQQMVEAMRPVLAFLNNLVAETKFDEDRRPLHKAVDEAAAVEVGSIQLRESFLSPKAAKAPKETEGRIAYSRPLKEIEVAKERLKVTSNRDVGEKSFDYFYKRECAD